jgi:protein-disulfide isomerase
VHIRLFLLLGLLMAISAACATDAQTSGDASGTVALVGATSITLADVDARALNESTSEYGGMRLSQALYQARRNALDLIVGNTLLDQEAKARSIDRAALVEQEITGKVTTPTDADISAWYEANPARVQGAPLEEVRAPIKAFLVQERVRDARERFLEQLRARTPVKILLEQPREKIAADGRPARGSASAPVEIIEFSDFQCPYCLRAYPTVKQIIATYGDRVRLVYRHYPLPNHPNARPAAEASACAAEQGKFWEYHDQLFEHQAQLTDADLKQYAAAVRLDTAKFDECFSSRRYGKDIDADMEAGRSAGVSGTPGFFVNGRPIDGAQPFEAFKTIIDEELGR